MALGGGGKRNERVAKARIGVCRKVFRVCGSDLDSIFAGD